MCDVKWDREREREQAGPLSPFLFPRERERAKTVSASVTPANFQQQFVYTSTCDADTYDDDIHRSRQVSGLQKNKLGAREREEEREVWCLSARPSFSGSQQVLFCGYSAEWRQFRERMRAISDRQLAATASAAAE